MAPPAFSDSSPVAALPSVPVTYTSSPGLAPARVSTRRGRTLPVAVTSIVNGPVVRVMFPPTSATRYRAASANRPSTIPSSVPTSRSSGSTQRQQRRPWLGAHRCEVTQIDRKRPVTHRVGRDEPEVEVDAVDQGVGRQYVERAANRLDDGGVIAWAHSNPRWCGEARGDPGDERALAEGGDRGVSQKQKPRFAVWGGRMNLRKQVEPLL